jgi:hypothetical protein
VIEATAPSISATQRVELQAIIDSIKFVPHAP